MIRSQIRTVAIAAAVATVGLGAIACGASEQPAGTTASATMPASNQAGAQSSYSYYQSMMGRYFGGSMMGGSRGRMMSPAGYRWMTGVNGVPGWLRGGRFPAFMMGNGMMSADPGKFMGRLWADAPGPRVTQPRRHARETRSPQAPTSTRRRAPSPSPPAACTWRSWPARRVAPMRPSASRAWSTPRSPSRPGPRSASRSSTPTQTPPTAWSSPAASAGPHAVSYTHLTLPTKA